MAPEMTVNDYIEKAANFTAEHTVYRGLQALSYLMGFGKWGTKKTVNKKNGKRLWDFTKWSAEKTNDFLKYIGPSSRNRPEVDIDEVLRERAREESDLAGRLGGSASGGDILDRASAYEAALRLSARADDSDTE